MLLISASGGETRVGTVRGGARLLRRRIFVCLAKGFLQILVQI